MEIQGCIGAIQRLWIREISLFAIRKEKKKNWIWMGLTDWLLRADGAYLFSTVLNTLLRTKECNDKDQNIDP